MFTGIVEEVGRIREVAPNRLTIRGTTALEGLCIGDSIAVNGVCLTVVELQNGGIAVDITPETLRLTNLGLLVPDDPVDLERPVAMGGRLDGHMVQGHVEGTGRVLSVEREENAVVISIEAPAEIMRYVVTKGFIAVDGISLTVVEPGNSSFNVSVISYSLEHTVLSFRKPGDVVNLETDIIARYVERLVGSG
jgi:riboflavin synthase